MLLFVWSIALKNFMSGSCFGSGPGIPCRLYCNSVSICWLPNVFSKRKQHWRMFSEASVPSDS